MKRSSRGTTRLFWSTVGIILLLCVLPPTGWLVRAEWRGLFVSPPGVSQLFKDMGTKEYPGIRLVSAQPDPAALQQTAARSPEDFDLQVAAAFNVPAQGDIPPSTLRARKLAALTKRFPHRPEVYAHLVRVLCVGPIQLRRYRDEAMLTGETPVPENPDTLPDPASLRQFNSAVARGETLDPSNAYFPMMEAASHFISHEDDLGVRALIRASHLQRWNDYVSGEAASDIRLQEATRGRLPGLERGLIGGGILLPHYALLRSAARAAACQAVRFELEGLRSDWQESTEASYQEVLTKQREKTLEGLAIRHALMRCGSLMRAGSSCYIGSLVGIAISEIGAARPGGAAALGPKLGGLNDIHDISQKSEAIQSAYSAYLTRIRQPDEARWGGQVLKTGRVIRETGRLAEDWSPLSGQPLRNLMAWWVLDLSLLSSGLCLVFLAGIAGLRWKNREGRVPLLTVVGSLMVIVSFSAIVPWTGAFADLLQMISGWCTCLTPERVGPSSALSLLFFGFPGARVVCVLGTAGLAMILIAVSVLPAVLKGRPLAPAILQGVRTRFVPLGCVLLLLYGGCLITTLSVENSYNQKLNQVIQHEGQCLLRTQGLPWPAAER